MYGQFLSSSHHLHTCVNTSNALPQRRAILFLQKDSTVTQICSSSHRNLCGPEELPLLYRLKITLRWRMWLDGLLGRSPSALHARPSNPLFSRSLPFRPDKDGYPCGSLSRHAHRSSLFFYFCSMLFSPFFIAAGSETLTTSCCDFSSTTVWFYIYLHWIKCPIIFHCQVFKSSVDI